MSGIAPGQAAIVYNPQAGALDTERTVRWAVEGLESAGWQTSLAPTHTAAELTRFASDFAKQNYPLVFAAGGDGTAGAVAEGLAHTQTALGVLPIGTANIWANELGLTQSLGSAKGVAACQTAQLQGTVRLVDLGECEGRKFLLWAGIGLDAHIIQRIEPRPAIGKRLGQAYYLASALLAGINFRGGPMTIRTEQGEQRNTKMLAIVANVQHYAGNDSVLDDETQADDGLFEVWSMNGTSYWEGIQHLIQFKLGRHRHRAGIERLRGQEIMIEVEAPMPLQFDGEWYGLVRQAHIRLLPKALRVLVPNQPNIRILKETTASTTD